MTPRMAEIEARLKEITARIAEIETEKTEKRTEIDGADEKKLAEIKEAAEKLSAESGDLQAETDKLNKEANEIRKVEADAKVAAEKGTEIKKEEERKMEEVYTRDSIEYRNAWLNKLRGVALSDVEERAFAAAGTAIATETANDILTAVKDAAPLLSKVTVVYSASQIKYYIEGTNADAADHTENAAITAAADTLTAVTLTPAEIVKLIQVSEAAKMMSVGAFEAWLTKNLGEAIAKQINAKIIALMATATAAASTITSANVQLMLGSVKGTATIVCNRKTLFTALLPLQDNSKSSIVKFDGGAASIYGTEVMVDDNVADAVVLCGDLSKIVAAMAEQVTVRNSYDIDTNSYKYLGVALFDCKMGILGAFSKLSA